jgi:hypothetical protein
MDGALFVFVLCVSVTWSHSMAHPSTQALAKATLPRARPALASRVLFTSTT